MLSWQEFAAAESALAEAGRGLLYQFGVGLAYLSTVRPDGGPRLHPICPLFAGSGLYAFLVPSPKRADLLRDGRYALHSFPPADNEDAFYLTGSATLDTDPAIRSLAAGVFLAERGPETPPPGFADQWLFELKVDRCLLTRTSGHGDYHPQHTTWSAAAPDKRGS